MKDEIKSFLVQIKGNDEWKEIYNYITNLQEENERLKEILHWKQIENNIFYKSRNEKAIEYIYKLQRNDDIEIWRENGYWAYLLNILQGEEK